LGLFALGPWYSKIVEPPKARADELHDRIDVLTRGFLGPTVACARCHDHKYDPISTRDYYSLAGLLYNTTAHEYPLADASAVKAWHEADGRIKAVDEEIQKLLDAERKTLAERLAREASRYLAAAFEGRPSATGLDAEVIERWSRYLNQPRDHQSRAQGVGHLENSSGHPLGHGVVEVSAFIGVHQRPS